jgi:hypothetical protein
MLDYVRLRSAEWAYQGFLPRRSSRRPPMMVMSTSEESPLNQHEIAIVSEGATHTRRTPSTISLTPLFPLQKYQLAHTPIHIEVPGSTLQVHSCPLCPSMATQTRPMPAAHTPCPHHEQSWSVLRHTGNSAHTGPLHPIIPLLRTVLPICQLLRGLCRTVLCQLCQAMPTTSKPPIP